VVRQGCRAAGVLAVCALITALLAPAAFGAVEVGDTGDLPSTSQKLGPPGAMTEIHGWLGTPGAEKGDLADRDVFQVCARTPEEFSATTYNGIPSTGFDSQLFLFDENGLGVYANDDGPSPTGPSSTLPANHPEGPKDDEEEDANGDDVDVYYLAISHYNFDPISAGGVIFRDRVFVVGPEGPGWASPVTGWTRLAGSPVGEMRVPGEYRIFLTGVESCIPPDLTAPEILVRTPPDGAVYEQGEPVTADYECVEEEGGSGLASCSGTVPSGHAIDTSELGEKTFTVTTSDAEGNTATVTHTYTVVDRTPPVITIASPLDGSVFQFRQPVFASYSCADEPGGSGVADCIGDVPHGAKIDTRTPGLHTFTVRASDAAGNTAQATASYTVLFNFGGFLRPIVNPPGVNTVRAGKSVQLKFILDRLRGRGVYAPGYPRSGEVPCDFNEDVALGEPTKGKRKRRPYKRDRELHRYLWETEKEWAGTCRQFVLKLVDGTEHRANFRFTGKPAKPSKPGKRPKPASPDKPKPGKPGDPDSPGRPNNPGRPDNPGKPDNAGKPEHSGKPQKPEKPGKPQKAEKPEKPGKPGHDKGD
jgi:hypothetical protein